MKFVLISEFIVVLTIACTSFAASSSAIDSELLLQDAITCQRQGMRVRVCPALNSKLANSTDQEARNFVITLIDCDEETPNKIPLLACGQILTKAKICQSKGLSISQCDLSSSQSGPMVDWFRNAMIECIHVGISVDQCI